jgi:ribosomal-protein-alanine N-acetyltransferase
MRAPGWPAVLNDGPVQVRPLRLRDASTWVEIRLRNADWLAPWEATPPGVTMVRETWAQRQTLTVYRQMWHRLRQQARLGYALPFAMVFRGRLVGQVTVSTIVRGAFNSGQVGYWVDNEYAGLGITPTALALVTDHCFGAVGLHRVEANVRPENTASRQVLAKLGFREEGLHRRYLAIDGRYRDHLGYALTTEDVPEGLMHRWRESRSSRLPGCSGQP